MNNIQAGKARQGKAKGKDCKAWESVFSVCLFAFFKEVGGDPHIIPEKSAMLSAIHNCISVIFFFRKFWGSI
jgi:hypothetical protein